MKARLVKWFWVDNEGAIYSRKEYIAQCCIISASYVVYGILIWLAISILIRLEFITVPDLVLACGFCVIAISLIQSWLFLASKSIEVKALRRRLNDIY